MTTNLAISLATSDAHSLMTELAEYRNQMMVLAEGAHQTSGENLDHRINSLKNHLEDQRENVAFDTLSFPDGIEEKPRQAILDALANLPQSLGAVDDLHHLDDLDVETCFTTCRILLGQLCGILTIWPPELQSYSSMAFFAKKLVGMAIFIDAEEASPAEKGDEGYRSGME